MSSPIRFNFKQESKFAKVSRRWNRIGAPVERFSFNRLWRLFIGVMAGFFVAICYTYIVADAVGSSIDDRYCRTAYSPSVGNYELCLSE